MKRSSVAVATVLLAFTASVASSQDHTHPQGEQLGTVRFETSCSPAVRPQFERGIALLHSFEFGASIRAFNDVLAADSTCAMTHWGIAISRWGNPMAAGNRAPELIRQAKVASDAAGRRGALASARARGCIRALSVLLDDFEHKPHVSRVPA